MTHKWVEVTIRLIGEDYKQTVDVYSQRISHDYFQQQKPDMVAEIAAVVNGLPMPTQQKPMDFTDKPTKG
jgi:hypothetical protein